MSKPEFKQLLEEYISNLEIDYTSNQNGTSIHPISSLIQDLIDITSLGDRVLLVREKIKFFDFDYSEIKEMIIDIDKIYHLERLAYLKKYYELMKPTFDGNKNKNTNYESNPIERLIAINQIIETTKIPIQNEEKVHLRAVIIFNSIPDVNAFIIKVMNGFISKNIIPGFYNKYYLATKSGCCNSLICSFATWIHKKDTS